LSEQIERLTKVLESLSARLDRLEHRVELDR
jgi:hypothetical protein